MSIGFSNELSIGELEQFVNQFDLDRDSRESGSKL